MLEALQHPQDGSTNSVQMSVLLSSDDVSKYNKYENDLVNATAGRSFVWIHMQKCSITRPS